MSDGLSHYARIIVRSGDISDWERKFCASIIKKTNGGSALSKKQEAVMNRIVKAFIARANEADEVKE